MPPAPSLLLPARPGVITGWGQVGVPGREVRGEDLETLTRDAVLTRGLGRSYGDSALPPPGVERVVGTRLADRILAFDPETGLLRAEAGLSLLDLKRIFLPRGFFTPVSPGTQHVTLGGMVASDVHGKNHHVHGTVGRHVRAMRMRVADGRVLEVTRESHSDLFRATLGGMGLTGHVLEVELTLERIQSPWIWQKAVRVRDIDEMAEKLKEAAAEWPMTVAWVDTLARGRQAGRGILTMGRWAAPDEAPKEPPRTRRGPAVPFRLPSFSINDLTTRLFNAVYFRKPLRQGVEHPDPFFYPLDGIRDWYRLYGRAGMTQHQCVLPDDAPAGSLRRYVELLSARGGTSPVCVIKDCGPEGEGVLSFPRRGMSVALDFPLRSRTQALVDELNRFVIDVGGRIYLTKDALTRAEDYRAMDPRVDEFLAIRRRWDPEGRLQSAQSLRLFGW
jgi:FAD/FMN-containing dehydrogenase